MQIKFKDTDIYYTSQGSGRPLVFLHGFLESSEIWKEFIPEISKERQVICIDLPGHGNSGCFAEVHSMKEMAESVKAVLDELKIKEVSLAGHSMGGYVSLEFCKNFSTMTRAVALINSTPEADDEERKLNRDRSVRLVRENKRAYISMAISNLLTKENNKIFKQELKVLKENAMKIPTKGITAALLGMKERKDHTDTFTAFSGKKYIVAGIRDPVLNAEQLEELALACKSNFRCFPDGHLSFLENEDSLLNYLHLVE